ncbi:MAG: peptidoglycan-binding protein [Deltaproteobacteria bacterium]|nr:MAG: peptidoglycan-binding protein [Deltaproteobacteria bacterium]
MVLICSLSLMISGCMSSMKTGSSAAKTTATGAVGGVNAQNANPDLERCSATLGTMAIYEDQHAHWYYYLTRDLRLPSTVPVIRLLAQQSNCFVIVERGRAMDQMMQERELMQSGEMRSGSNFGKGQMVAADYTVTPSITFSADNTGGAGAVIGGLFGSVAGAIAGGLSTSDASTVLTLVENRSGVQLAAAEGSARNMDFNLLGGLFSTVGVGAGAYGNTPEGKVIVAAFTDSFNNLIRAVKAYKAQSVAGGLGTGGSLAVQGSQQAAMASGNMLQGVMTERVYNASANMYDYVVITKDKSQTFTFSSPKKFPYKNDLIQFSLAGNQLDPQSIRLVERKYLQKYWQ